MKTLPPPSVLWLEGLRRPRHPRLEERVEADVVVVGAGITGLTAAELLRRENRRVVVIDAGRVAGGTTGGSSAHVTEVLDIGYADLINRHGEGHAAAFVRAARAGLEWIAAFAEGEARSAFERVPGYRFTERRDAVDLLDRDLHAARRLGVRVEVAAAPLPFRTVRALRFPAQGRFDPARYTLALARVFTEGGGRLFENSRAVRVEGDDAGCRVHTAQGEVRARAALLATHVPINFDVVQTELRPELSYLIAFRAKDPGAAALFWDTETPYHYVRAAADEDGALLLVGGEDHRTGHGEDTRGRYRRLEAWARERFALGPVVHRWSAQLFEPADGMPYVGSSSSSPCVRIATGFSGTGLTVGTAAAMQIAAEIAGRERPFGDALDSRRIRPLAGGAEILRKNLSDVAGFVRDRLEGGEVASAAAVPRGEGRLVAVGGEKLAVYRDEKGKLHAFSPTCRHLGCHVRWNAAERTWDCPCHGGRYEPTGGVLEGPPTDHLEPRTIPSGTRAPGAGIGRRRREVSP